MVQHMDCSQTAFVLVGCKYLLCHIPQPMCKDCPRLHKTPSTEGTTALRGLLLTGSCQISSCNITQAQSA